MPRSSVLVCALLAILLAGYIKAQELRNANASYGGQLRIGVLDVPQTPLNPFEIDSPQQKEIIQLIFGYGLTKKSDKFANPPALIERYLPVSGRDEGRIWRLLLNRNISFQDGGNLRNTDVKFTFELLKEFGGHILNRPIDFSNIKYITTTGDLELSFELFTPDPGFGLKLSDIPILPARYYQPALTDGYEVFRKLKPVGMGPFQYVSQSNGRLSLRFHPHYFTGRPFLDAVEVRYFYDEQELVNAVVNEEVDYLELPDIVTARRLHDMMGRKIVVFTVPRPEVKVYSLLFGMQRFPLNEPEVREALYLAMNRRGIVERIVKEYGQVANTLLTEANSYYEKSLFSDEFKPQEALRILTASGWVLNRQTRILEKNGRPLTFDLLFTHNSALEENLARTIKVDLGELHIDVHAVPISKSDKADQLSNSSYQAMIYDYSYDPQYLFEAFRHYYFDILGAQQKVPNYRNRYLTRLYNLVRDKEDYHKNFYQRFQMFARQELPAIFLLFDERIIVALGNRFSDARTSFQDKSTDRFFYRMNPIENWFIPKELQDR